MMYPAPTQAAVVGCCVSEFCVDSQLRLRSTVHLFDTFFVWHMVWYELNFLESFSICSFFIDEEKNKYQMMFFVVNLFSPEYC